MQVIVHYPKNDEDISNLCKKVADVHIEAVTGYLQKLACPKEQKLRLLKSIEK